LLPNCALTFLRAFSGSASLCTTIAKACSAPELQVQQDEGQRRKDAKDGGKKDATKKKKTKKKQKKKAKAKAEEL
jgi:hypothetical protein